MKLHLSREEICVLLTKALGQKVHKIVIIKKGNIVPDNFYNKTMDRFRRDSILDAKDNILRHKQLEAIKLVQKLFLPKNSKGILTFDQAWQVVQDWTWIKAYIKKHNAYPSVIAEDGARIKILNRS